MQKKIPLTIGVFILALCLIGCNSSTPQASAQETKDFKGGPMPQDVKERLAADQKKMADSIAERAAGGANGPHTTPSAPPPTGQ